MEDKGTDGRKIARELFGLFLIFWGLLVLLSLLSFDQTDPGINHAVSRSVAVKNSAGLFGAYISGLLVDIFGFASLVWPAVFIAWGAGCVSTWFTLPWWRWFGFLVLGACLISLGAAWNLGVGDVRGGGMLGMSLYRQGTAMFNPVGSTLIWLFLLFLSLELAFGIAWLSLIKRGALYLKAKLDEKKLSWASVAATLPKMTMPKLALPHRERKESELLDIIPLYDIHIEEPLRGAVPHLNDETENGASAATEGVDTPSLMACTNATDAAQTQAPAATHGTQFIFPDPAPLPPMPVGPGPEPGTELGTEPGTELGPELGMIQPVAQAPGQTPQPPLPTRGPALVPSSVPNTASSAPAARGTVHQESEPFTPLCMEPCGVEAAGMELLSMEPIWEEKRALLSAVPIPVPVPVPVPAPMPSPVQVQPVQPQATPAPTPAPYIAPQPMPQTASPQAAAPYVAPQAAVQATAQVGSPPLSGAPAFAMPEKASDADAPNLGESGDRGSVTMTVPGLVPVAAPMRKRPLPLPSLDLLQAPQQSDALPSRDVLEHQSQELMNCLADFNVQGELVRVTPGPVITLFEIRPAPGVRVGRITNLNDDLARTLMAEAVRIQAPVPGCDTVGIEIPNAMRATVNFRELVQSEAFQRSDSRLTMALGKDIEGRPAVRDLASMPHVLVAGTTGSGKSVCLNSILVSFLYKASPDELKLMLIDPKRVEMAMYSDLPHLVHPVVTEMTLAKTALDWAVQEMDHRYDCLARFGVKNIKDFNKKFLALEGNLPPALADLTYLPYLVIVVDELADLMLTAGKEVEGCLVRLAQLARAAGIHLIVATQRPSVDVVTGLIKANFPCRVAFQVANKYDSRTILDSAGAEQLLGKGDMLYKPTGGKLQRLHGPFVTDDEVQAVVDHWKRQRSAQYEVDFSEWGSSMAEAKGASGSSSASGASGAADEEALYAEATTFVQEQGRMSISLLQRRFRIGFNKAARFVERMEQDGILPPASRANKARQVRPD